MSQNPQESLKVKNNLERNYLTVLRKQVTLAIPALDLNLLKKISIGFLSGSTVTGLTLPVPELQLRGTKIWSCAKSKKFTIVPLFQLEFSFDIVEM